MQISKVFKYIKCGKDPNKMSTRPNEVMIVKKIQKDSMQCSKFIESRFVPVKLPFEIDDKYFLQKGDIIVSLKEPYCASALSHDIKEKVLIPNNYAVLRDIDKDKYNFIFIVNYLNLIGIKKLVDNHKENNIHTDLTLSDIEDLELPNIPLDKQKSIISLCAAISDRAVIYETIKDNDKKIIEFAMKELIGDKDV